MGANGAARRFSGSAIRRVVRWGALDLRRRIVRSPSVDEVIECDGEIS